MPTLPMLEQVCKSALKDPSAPLRSLPFSSLLNNHLAVQVALKLASALSLPHCCTIGRCAVHDAGDVPIQNLQISERPTGQLDLP